MKQRVEELEAFLNERQEQVTDYDEGMVRRLIERITVFDDRLAFEFKCGLETEVQMKERILIIDTVIKKVPPVRLDHYRDPTPLPSFAKPALRKAQRYCIRCLLIRTLILCFDKSSTESRTAWQPHR